MRAEFSDGTAYVDALYTCQLFRPDALATYTSSDDTIVAVNSDAVATLLNNSAYPVVLTATLKVREATCKEGACAAHMLIVF